MPDLPALARPQFARLHLRTGRLRLRAELSVTPAGLLAAGALVCGILLSVPPIVRAAGKVAARRNGEGGPTRE